MRNAANNTTRYHGVPETPSSLRKSVPDLKLHEIQQKLELAMHCMVGSCEQANQDLLLRAAAFVRSAYQDVQEQRRWNLARGQAWKLDKRPDAQTATLLTKQEEDKLRLGRRPRDTRRPQQNTQPPHRTQFRSKSGKGKGKGGWKSSSSHGKKHTDDQE